MTADSISKHVEQGLLNSKPVSIFFKQRNTMVGFFIKEHDYEDMKAKNFWRIVSEAKVKEWKKTKDSNLARIYSGESFSRIKETAQ